MKKNIITLMLCVSMLLGLSGCSASDTMARIRDESGVKTSTGSAAVREDDAGRPEDEPVIEAASLTPHEAETQRVEDSEDYGLDNVYVGWTVTYPGDLPDAMQEKLLAMKDGYLPGGDGSTIIARGKANRGKWVSYTVEITCEAYEEGYYSVTAYVTENLNDTLRWNKYRFLSCFDASFNKLTLSDVFADSFDSGSYITEALKQYWILSYGSDENFELDYGEENGELTDEYASELVSGSTFTLTENEMLFATPLMDITEKSADTEEVNSYASSMTLSIPYSEIEAEMPEIFR